MPEPVNAMTRDDALLAGELVMGQGVLSREMATFEDYVVVTTSTPWAMVADAASWTPRAVITARSLERSSLDLLVHQVPAGVDIIGVGGGLALDVAKYLARARNRPVTLVPTAMSSNGPFTNWISVRSRGRPAGFQDQDLRRRVVIDLDVIGRADPRMNRAGYGDLLPLQTTLTDWEIAAREGVSAIDHDILGRGRALMREAIDGAATIGALDRDGLGLLVHLTRESTALMLAHPALPLGAGSEHLFAWALETVTDTGALHGELVALGIVISSFLQQRDHAALASALGQAQVACHPDDLGLGWDDIRRALVSIDRYNRDVRRFHTVYDHVELTTQVLSGIREVVFALPGR